MMIKWWKDNGWKVRIKIYSIIIFPVELIEIIIEFLANCYRKFFCWILWDVMNKVFCTKKPKEVWDEIRRNKKNE